MLLRKIDEKGLTDAECYKKANVPAHTMFIITTDGEENASYKYSSDTWGLRLSGVFKNPARLVAEAFNSVIESKQYCKKFKNIIFSLRERFVLNQECLIWMTHGGDR